MIGKDKCLNLRRILVIHIGRHYRVQEIVRFRDIDL
jgi:hypothetical protein